MVSRGWSDEVAKSLNPFLPTQLNDREHMERARTEQGAYMYFPESIIKAVGEFAPAKLEAILSLRFELTEGEWPGLITIEMLYGSEWLIQMKFLQVRTAKFPIFNGKMMDLGEVCIQKVEAGDSQGLFVFADELKSYRILCGEVVTGSVTRLRSDTVGFSS